MKKEDINNELISKIEIQIQDTQFYLPGETIKGKILLNPQYKIKEETLHITIKIMQYEFWDYINKEIKELKNIYTTIIQEENIEYKLEKEKLPKKENVEGFENCSIIMKEDDNKVISIPFEIKLDDKKILPTFQFENKEYFLGIRHLILVECKEYNSSNYTGLFIGKNKNIEMSKPKEIKENYIVGLGSLEIIANFPKLSIAPGEEINVEIKTNSNLHFKKITKITQTFYRNIKWVGYMKNTLLDKHIFETNSSEYNKKTYNLLDKLTFPIRPLISSVKEGINYGKDAYEFVNHPPDFDIAGCFDVLINIDNPDHENKKLIQEKEVKVENDPFRAIVGTAVGATIGGIAGMVYAPVGLAKGFFKGFKEQGGIIKECLNMNYKINNMNSNFKNKINEDKKLLLIENIKKFVYFKDDKVAGFIKFAQNITPNVNGYYFNCEYNMRIDVDIEGIILNRNKYLKTQFDLYDYEEYITYMKKVFKN